VAAFDEIARVIWIHAGYDGSLCQDLWKFDMNTYHWTWVSSDGPSARAYHAAGWDPMNLALWIHGGFDGVALQDLWRFGTVGNTWELIADGGPSPRFHHVAAFDATSLAFVIHGGYGSGLLQDIWRFQASTMTTSSSFTQTTTTVTTATISTTSMINAANDGSIVPPDADLAAPIVAGVLAVAAILLLMLYFFCKFCRQDSVLPERPVPPVPPGVPPQVQASLASPNHTNTQVAQVPAAHHVASPPVPPGLPLQLPEFSLAVVPTSQLMAAPGCTGDHAIAVQVVSEGNRCIQLAPEMEYRTGSAVAARYPPCAPGCPHRGHIFPMGELHQLG